MKSYNNIQDIPWSLLSTREAAYHVKKLADLAREKDSEGITLLVTARDYETLSRWLSQAHHYDIGIYKARIEIANAERKAENETFSDFPS